MALSLKPNAVYRITALAYGRKRNPPDVANPSGTPQTRVVLQETYVRQRKMD
jgi:hypothetical protein